MKTALWDMINTLVLDTVAVQPTLVAQFPLALANIRPWPLVPFFEIYLKNSEQKTTHNTLREYRVHFSRQPFSKQLYISVLNAKVSRME